MPNQLLLQSPSCLGQNLWIHLWLFFFSLPHHPILLAFHSKRRRLNDSPPALFLPIVLGQATIGSCNSLLTGLPAPVLSSHSLVSIFHTHRPFENPNQFCKHLWIITAGKNQQRMLKPLGSSLLGTGYLQTQSWGNRCLYKWRHLMGSILRQER